MNFKKHKNEFYTIHRHSMLFCCYACTAFPVRALLLTEEINVCSQKFKNRLLNNIGSNNLIQDIKLLKTDITDSINLFY